MQKKKTILIILLILSFAISNGQHHNFGIIFGYTKSMATQPNNKLYFNESEITIEEGQRQFKGLDGFQIGINAYIDIGNDFSHLKIAPQYSKYGFKDNRKIEYDYLDVDIGYSNFNAEVYSKIVYEVGFTPSFILYSKQLENINNFDFKAFMSFGYRPYKNYVIYTQLRFGFLEILPKSKIKNLQLSLNINIPILKLKKS